MTIYQDFDIVVGKNLKIHNLQWNPEVRKIVGVGGELEGNAVLVPGTCFSNVPVTFWAQKAVLYFRVYI